MEWHVWDFPDNIRIYLDEDFRIEIFRLLKGNESRNKLAKKFGISTSIIKSYFQTGKDSEGLKTYIPVKIIKKIPEILSIPSDSKFMERLEKNIIAYRSRSGNSVVNPILPIKESPEIYSIVAHMICDGSAGERKTPCYYNTRKELREEFTKSLQIFGRVETNEYLVQLNVYAVMFPKAITDILSHIFEVKFVKTPKLPALFFKASADCRIAAIRSMFDDEGTVNKSGQVVFTQKEQGIIKDLKILLSDTEIKTGIIHTDKNNCNSITVLSESRGMFSDLINFSHIEKNNRFKEVIKKDNIRKNYKPLIDKINELFLTEDKVTRFDVCKKLDANINSATEILYRLRKEGKLSSKFMGKNKPYVWSKASF